MNTARFAREKKRQLGQFFTPVDVARAVVGGMDVSPAWRILEPSFGDGAFVFAIAEQVAPLLSAGGVAEWGARHLFGCELDDGAYAAFARQWRARGWGEAPKTMVRGDFFTWMPPGVDAAVATDRRRYFNVDMARFDLVIGNPPFGGCIAAPIQDSLDAVLGTRDNRKIKKESYAFFIVKSLDLLKPGGELVFICSDTMLTISTMAGLRLWLQNHYTVTISAVPGEFADTSQSMILLRIKKRANPHQTVSIFGTALSPARVALTPNRSWRINGELTKYFTGAAVGDKMVATSGMTIGKNELFVRKIADGCIVEPYDFFLTREKITLEKEIGRARLGRLSDKRRADIAALVAAGATEEVLGWRALAAPSTVRLPHADYAYFNKASSRIVYAPPEWALFWKEEGRYVYTFKKNGNWYLHGVGGRKYFAREGLTWPLVAARLHTRYLPPGYILDSGAPCAFLRPGVPDEELFFILGWSLTRLCSRLLKEVINHTRNNQGKDFERLPYPVWIEAERKVRAIAAARALLAEAQAGRGFSFADAEVARLEELYAWRRPPALAGGRVGEECQRALW